MLLEARAPWEYAAAWAAMPWLRRGPKGDGHPVIVLPGFQASDASTAPMRRFLHARGYTPYGWGLGTNHGPGRGVREAMAATALALLDDSGSMQGDAI